MKTVLNAPKIKLIELQAEEITPVIRAKAQATKLTPKEELLNL